VRHAAGGGAWNITGIRPPMNSLAVAVGAGAGGSSGLCLAAITFIHRAGARVLAESNFGNVVNVGELGGLGRAWSTIDDSSAESRVTDVRGYVSMNGNDFRMAWEAPYGLSSITENVRTAQLTFLGPQEYDHVPPPPAKFAHSWSGRMWYANSAKFPYRVWFSLPGEPQYLKNASFRDTLDREPITAIWKGRNELLVLCERACYMIRSASGQPGSDDFVMEKLDSDVGCITHFGIWEIHNKLWLPGEDGVWIYDGGFRYLMKEIQPLWRQDSGFGDMLPGDVSNRQIFRDGFAMHDKQNKVYSFVTNRPARPEFERTDLFPGTVGYAGYYGSFEPSMAGESRHPEWTLDFKDRFDSCAFYNREGELVIGSCDGKIRKQDRTQGDDDGDLLEKALIIRPGHQLFFEPGDELEFGKELAQLWTYVESETTGWTLYVRGGDEQAWRSQLPDNERWLWKIDEAASLSEETRTLRGRNIREAARTYKLKYVPQTVHTFTPTEKISGRGFTFELRATAPIGMEYRGLGGVWARGATQRGVEDKTEYGVTLFEISDDDGATWATILPGETATVTGCPKTVLFRVTLAYSYGAAAFPISVTVAGAGASPISETIVLAGPGLVATTVGSTLAVGTLTMSVSAVDVNLIPSNPLLYPITVIGQA
jgi:hypothetical protein